MKTPAMKTIEADAVVESGGQLLVKLPPDVTPGKYRIVLVMVEEQPANDKPSRPPLDFPVDDWGPWPEGLSLRREDMYGDDGR